jgi:hypothetical protein
MSAEPPPGAGKGCAPVAVTVPVPEPEVTTESVKEVGPPGLLQPVMAKAAQDIMAKANGKKARERMKN